MMRIKSLSVTVLYRCTTIDKDAYQFFCKYKQYVSNKQEKPMNYNKKQ